MLLVFYAVCMCVVIALTWCIYRMRVNGAFVSPPKTHLFKAVLPQLKSGDLLLLDEPKARVALSIICPTPVVWNHVGLLHTDRSGVLHVLDYRSYKKLGYSPFVQKFSVYSRKCHIAVRLLNQPLPYVVQQRLDVLVDDLCRVKRSSQPTLLPTIGTCAKKYMYGIEEGIQTRQHSSLCTDFVTNILETIGLARVSLYTCIEPDFYYGSRINSLLHSPHYYGDQIHVS